MAGIADVAALAGVSKATASRALSGAGSVSEATRKRVAAAAAALAYVPSTSAVNLATGRTQAVGVIMPAVQPWFFSAVLEGIQSTLLERGYDLTLYGVQAGPSAQPRKFEESLARRRFDGIIAVGLTPERAETSRLEEIGCPVVCVVGTLPGSSTISIDDDDAARRATEHLLALGHEAIAFLGSGISPVYQRRVEGYLTAMKDAGLLATTRLIAAEPTMPGGYEAAVDALGDARDRPTALVGVCDEAAIGAIIAARRLGIGVPSDLSIVGIDNHEYAEMFALTTLEQLPREQGAAAVDLLLAHIDDPDLDPTTTLVRARLVVRNSTTRKTTDAGVAP